MARFKRTAPPRSPAGPPASLKEGAAAVIAAATKLFDRQDGEGVEKRLLASILFTAAFDVLDRITDAEQKKPSPGASTRARMSAWKGIGLAVLKPGTRGRAGMLNRCPVPVRVRPDLARRGRENRGSTPALPVVGRQVKPGRRSPF